MIWIVILSFLLWANSVKSLTQTNDTDVKEVFDISLPELQTFLCPPMVYEHRRNIWLKTEVKKTENNKTLCEIWYTEDTVTLLKTLIDQDFSYVVKLNELN